MVNTSTRIPGTCAFCVSILALLTACSPGLQRPSPADAGIVITSLSNRADLVSGGDVLIAIDVPAEVSLAQVSLQRNGEDVSARMRAGDRGRIVALIDGLGLGVNELTARAGALGAKLTVTNHPRGGPVFSGPQIEPWICATPEAEPGDADRPATIASGLSTRAIDNACNIAAEVKLYYRTTAPCGPDPANPRQIVPCFKDYVTGGDQPADLKMVQDQRGNLIPYVVRVERGTLNRGIYDVAVLADPGGDPDPFRPSATWNGALMHVFGGSSGYPRRQYPPNSRWTIDDALSRGFMVSVSSLTDQALNSNKVVAAETLMMLKEHISENYGGISHTLGWGCSGGSIMQLVIAGTYPGLLDGIQPSCTYPDSVTTGLEVTDCVLLGNYFNSPAFVALTRDLDEDAISARKAAIAGHLDEKACLAWSGSYGQASSAGNFTRNGIRMNNCQLPTHWVFDPESNPSGIRCTQTDHEIALWGKEPGEDSGRRIADNTGILYGLKALESGRISVEEFVTLNEQIGGSDASSQLVRRRSEARADSVGLAYRMGFVTDARQWASVPMLDLRGNDNSGIHMNWRSFAVRDRLDRALGHHDNQVIWRFGPNLWPPAESTVGVDGLLTMDQWVRAIKADASPVPLPEKIVRNRPEAARDFCYLGNDYTTQVTEKARCDADPALAYYGSPRQVAGGPLAENILKCTLKALVRAEYGFEFTDNQWQRLQAVFPNGVCDWSVPGVGVQPAVPWLDYSNGPGGEPMPASPVAVAL